MTSRSRDYPYLRAVGAGVVTGMRTATAGAAITVAIRLGLLDVGPGRLGRLLRWPPTLPLTILAASGELAVDKLQIAPSRLDPGPLGGRIVGGAVTGAIVARGRGGSAATGAVFGSLAALASSWAFYHARARLGSVTGLPDAVVAGGEDALALSVAVATIVDWPQAGARP